MITAKLGRNAPRGCGRMSLDTVIARSNATRQSRATHTTLDCRVAPLLAMTEHLERYPSSSENSEKMARVRRQPRALARLTGSVEGCLILSIAGASRSLRGGGQWARCVPAVSLGRTCMKDVPLGSGDLLRLLLMASTSAR